MYSKPNFKNLSAVLSIRNLSLSERVNLLENEGGLNVYLRDNYKWVRLEAKQGNFNEFIDEKRINMIYYSIQLNNSVKLKRDSTWFEFINNPEAYDFRKIRTLNTGAIYVRKNVKIN
jgi:hypothetical protein